MSVSEQIILLWCWRDPIENSVNVMMLKHLKALHESLAKTPNYKLDV